MQEWAGKLARVAAGVAMGARTNRAAMTVFVVVMGALLASVSAAHGPTIKLLPGEMKPPLLNLFVGSTVHFSNTAETPSGSVVVDAGGTLESPTLRKPGDGWHYTFEVPGTFNVCIREDPDAKAKIVVIPKR